MVSSSSKENEGKRKSAESSTARAALLAGSEEEDDVSSCSAGCCCCADHLCKLNAASYEAGIGLLERFGRTCEFEGKVWLRQRAFINACLSAKS